MKNISNKRLDLYVINPLLLTIDETDYIENHIKESSLFRTKIEKIRKFYDIYKSIEDIDISNDEFFRRVKIWNQSKNTEVGFYSNKNILLMTPLYNKEYEEKYIKLVAQQKTKKNEKFKYINTLASVDDIVLIRVLWNCTSNEYNLFLIADNMEKVEYALLNFDNYSENYVADKNGFIKIKNDYQFNNINAIVHIPIAKFFIPIEDIVKLKNSKKVISKYKKEAITVIKKDDNNITITLNFSEDFYHRNKLKEKHRVVIIYNENVNNPVVKKMEDKSLTIPFSGNESINIVIV